MSESTWNDPRITAYVLDELSAPERAEFEAEIGRNQQLAAAVEEARGITGQLREFFADESTPGLDPERRATIASGATTMDHASGVSSGVSSGASSGVVGGGSAAPAAPVASAGRTRPWRLTVIVVATAATLLLLVGVAPLVQYGSIALNIDGSSSGDETSDFERAAAMEGSEAGANLAAEGTSAAPESAPGTRSDRNLARPGPESATTEQAGESASRRESRFRQRATHLGEADDRDSLSFRRPSTRVRPEAAVRDSLPKLKTSAGAKTVPAEGASPGMSSGTAPAAQGSHAAGQPTRWSRDASYSGGMHGAAGMGGGRGAMRGRLAEFEGAEAASPEVAGYGAGADQMPGRAKARGGYPYRADEAHRRESGAVASGGDEVAGGYGQGVEARIATQYETAVGEQVRPVPNKAAANASRTLGSRLVPDYSLPIDEGRGPGIAGDRFEPITDNPFRRVSEHPLSTFSVDVDTASYSKVRDFLLRANQLPRPDAVRIEELVNYFDYDYQPPSADAEHPFAARAEIASCPWNDEHRLARIAIKGKPIRASERPRCNLVFLLDTSGSMNAPNKLPLVRDGMRMLIGQLREDDRVAIVVYAGSAGRVLDSTPVSQNRKIRHALTELAAGGSTNGGAGIALAYQTARDHFVEGGVNRVMLCTDGDFNVGTTGTDELVRMVEREAKGGVFLSVLGFGMGNHNDAMLEKISGRGNGNYAFIDNREEARKVLVEQADGTLVTIAKDVKLQLEFNPVHVSSYRLIGYENRVLAKEDFNDDKKDAGEIGAGHAVTALYELVPADRKPDAIAPPVDELKYQRGPATTTAADSDEWLTLKLRYKQPDGETSTRVDFPLTDDGGTFESASDDFRFAAAVAGFGMQLRRSPYAGDWTLADVRRAAADAVGEARDGLRAEFLELVAKAQRLTGTETPSRQ